MTSFIMASKFVSSIAWILISLWCRTISIRYVNREVQDRNTADKKNVIYAFWHSDMFLLPFTHRNSGYVIMVSESRDGEAVARLLRHFGLAVVRGSSNRKGTQGLIGLIHSLQNGRSVGTAVDGPRGPRHEVKEGVVFLAGKTGVPIIPVAQGMRRSWTLNKTWDKFVVPVPFTEAVIQYGGPITVNGTSREEIETKRRELESTLRKMTDEAAEQAVASPEKESCATGGEPWYSKDTR